MTDYKESLRALFRGLGLFGLFVMSFNALLLARQDNFSSPWWWVIALFMPFACATIIDIFVIFYYYLIARSSEDKKNPFWQYYYKGLSWETARLQVAMACETKQQKIQLEEALRRKAREISPELARRVEVLLAKRDRGGASRLVTLTITDLERGARSAKARDQILRDRARAVGMTDDGR